VATNRYLRLKPRRRLCCQLVTQQVHLRHCSLCLLRLLLQLFTQKLKFMVRAEWRPGTR
jgi:hypothetical protein